MTESEFAALCRHLTGRSAPAESAAMDEWMAAHRYAVEVALHALLRRPEEMHQEFEWEPARNALLTTLLLRV